MDNRDFLTALIRSEQDHGIVATLHRYFGSNIKIHLNYSGSLCETGIDELQLSVRSWNALRRAGIDTVGQLISTINNEQLMKIRNLGRISMSEIKTKLMMLGFQALPPTGKTTFYQFLIENNKPL